MPAIRKQLSMYVPENAAKAIEEVRKTVDPIQSALIPAHITLCREDELDDLSKLHDRLSSIPFKPLTLRFGKPEIFSGRGLLLNCVEGADDFRLLREYLLDSKNIKNQMPHITLAHPRNPKSAGNLLSAAAALPDVITINFPAIYLIEQKAIAPWRILARYHLQDER
jgi:2'-5' RNA ligase